MRLDQKGQLAVIIPMLVVLGIGGALMWGYHRVALQQVSSGKAGFEATILAQNVLNRVRGLLTVEGPRAAAECGDSALATSINAQFQAFRNLNATPPAYVRDQLIPTAGFLGDCLIRPEEIFSTPTNPSIIQRIYIQVAPITSTTSPDLLGLSRAVSVTVRVETRPRRGNSELERQVTLTRTIPLRVASLKKYNVVFLPTSVAQTRPWITANDAIIRIKGPVFIANSNFDASQPYNLIANGNVTFEKRVDLRARSLTGLPNLDLTLFRNRFPAGISTAVLGAGVLWPEASATYGILPIEDSGPTGDAWTHRVAFRSSTNTTTGKPGALLPWLDLNDDTGSPSGLYIPLRAARKPTFLSAADQVLVPTPAPSRKPIPNPGDPGFLTAAVIDQIPVPLTGTMTSHWLEKARYSCRDSARPAPALVYLRTDRDLKIDLNQASGDYLLCGFIAARKITINLSGGGDFHILGALMAQQIVVNGGGSLTIANPIDNPALNLVFPAPEGTDQPQTLQSVAFQLQQVSMGAARNFFAPIFRGLPSLRTDRASRFRPTGPLSVVANIGGPLLLPGYVSPCEGTIADIPPACQGHWIKNTAANQALFNILTPCTPSTPLTEVCAQRANNNDLFVGAPFRDRLAFTAE